MTKLASLVGLCLVITSNCYALEGADYVNFRIKDKDYSAPIPNKATREDFRYLKMALKGDEIAREMLLGGKKEKFIYIGDVNVVRWVRLTETDIEVIEYDK